MLHWGFDRVVIGLEVALQPAGRRLRTCCVDEETTTVIGNALLLAFDCRGDVTDGCQVVFHEGHTIGEAAESWNDKRAVLNSLFPFGKSVLPNAEKNHRRPKVQRRRPRSSC